MHMPNTEIISIGRLMFEIFPKNETRVVFFIANKMIQKLGLVYTDSNNYSYSSCEATIVQCFLINFCAKIKYTTS